MGYQASGQGIIVLQALLLTAAVFLSLTTYVHVTKKDFSWMGGALFAGLMILIVWSFMSTLRRDLRRRRPHRLRADRRAPLLRLHPLRHEQPPPPLRPRRLRRGVDRALPRRHQLVPLFARDPPHAPGRRQLSSSD